MKKVLSLFVLLCLCFTNTVFCSADDTNVSVENETHFNYTFDDALTEYIEIADYYTSNIINLSYSINSSEIEFGSISTDGGYVEDVELGELVNFDFVVNEENSKVVIFSSYNGEIFSDVIYFNEYEGMYFTSTVSAAQAEREALYYQLQNGLISQDEYNAESYSLMVGNVSEQYSYTTLASEDVSDTTMDITLSWVDDSGTEHTLDYVKIDIIKRVYFGGVIDYPYYDTVVDTIYTNSNGYVNYDFSSATEDLYGYYIKVYAATDNTNVVDNNGEQYYYTSQIANSVPAGAVIYYNVDFTMESDVGKAFQLSQALKYAEMYAEYLSGNDNITECTLYYGDEGCYYDRYNHIYIKARTNDSIYPNGYADWDVVGHEYAHHVQKCYPSIAQNPGGTHYVDTNNADSQIDDNKKEPYDAKDRGMRLSWAEGWATYFGQMYQRYSATELANIPYVNDDYYTAANKVKHSLLLKGYESGSVHGETDEIAIAQILYQLDDSRTSGNDVFNYSDKTLWSLVYSNSTKTFDAFYDVLYSSVSNKNALARFLSDFKITPFDIHLISPDSIDIPPTFAWSDDNGSVYFPWDEYKVYVKTNSLGEVLIGTTSEAQITMPMTLWESIVNGNDAYYYVTVSASATEHISTGPYYSETYAFANPVESLQTTLIRPSAYGFPESYGTNTGVTTATHTLGSHTLITSRVRCGYIENQYVNLSARKQNVGEAYLEYQFDTPVYRFDANLSFWSDSEYLSATDSTAVIQYKNADGEWVTVVDLLDGTLPTDRTQQKTYTAIFPEGATNFRIYVSTRKIGTHNKGRISIGNVVLYYED